MEGLRSAKGGAAAGDWWDRGAKPPCQGSRSVAASAARWPKLGLVGLVAPGVQRGAICSLLVRTPSGAGAAPVLPPCCSVATGRCSAAPASSLWHRGPRTRFPESPGKSWSEFSPCLAGGKSFEALGKEFEIPPKFAENTYQMGGSQTASV